MNSMKCQTILFCFLILILAHQCERSRRKNKKRKYYRHAVCELTKVQVELTFDGCEKKTITTIGCRGNCKSEATVNIYKRKIETVCNCCKPIKEKEFQIRLNCPYRKEPTKLVSVLTARKCSCVRCGGIFRNS